MKLWCLLSTFVKVLAVTFASGLLEGLLSSNGRSQPPLVKRVRDQRKRIMNAGEYSSSPVVTLNFQKSGPPNLFHCRGCQAAMEILRYQVRTGKKDTVPSLVESTCTLLNLQTSDVCSGIARLFGPELVPVLNSTVNTLVICSFLLTQECTKVQLPKWEIPLPPELQRGQRTFSAANLTANTPRLKVLQITDTHYDAAYLEGAKVNCPEPLCCRVQNGLPTDGEKGAGKWGDWKCDIPERTLNSMLEHASRKNPDIDYILWTGDVPAHDIWKQSRASNLEQLDATVAKIKQYFPNVPVYPAVGNHEAAPTDIFPPPGAPRSVSWLYEALDKHWSTWLPRDTSDTIRHGGFYTTLVRPGLRIISLNTNYCYYRNWWLILHSADPANQLKWMVDVLRKAEEAGEKVQIIAHIAPGQDDCLPTWRDNYYRIVSRFRHTIANHFFGHSHKDEFELYFDDNNLLEPVGVGYLAPSVTTYTNLNPGYRIYYVDGDRENSSRMVLDFENWILDLDRSNKIKEAKWGRSYTAKSEYRMTSLLPKDWNKLYETMKTNDYIFKLYYRHSNKDSPKINVLSCEDNCKKSVLCVIKSCQKYVW